LKLQIVIPLWKRPEVTRFCFEQLQETIKAIPYDVNVLCVISEPEYGLMCDSFGFNFIHYKNDTVGEKINAGIKYALQNYQWDYIMMMNSDSVVKPELFEVYKPLMEAKEKFFGVNRVTFVNFYTDEAVDFTYEFSLIGPAKMIHRSVVQEMGGNCYKHLNRCLDDTLMDNILKTCKIGGKIVNYEGQLVYDIKSNVNIHPWEKFKNGKKVENELCSKAA
jgi:hypothetical protein